MPSVKSKDGTSLTFDESGKGGATIILVDGALCSRKIGPMPSLAQELAKDFTVIHYDRRGRGQSPETKPYALEREIEDLSALREKIGGSPFVYGVSSGAVLCVKSAAAGVKFKKMALFEPPLIAGHAPTSAAEIDHEERVLSYLKSGKNSAAITYFLNHMVGLPRFAPWLMRFSANWSKLKALAPTLPHDFEISKPGTFPFEMAATIHVPTLVLRSNRSPEPLRSSSEKMAAAIPRAKLIEVEGGRHTVSSAILIPQLKKFFAGETATFLAKTSGV